MEQPAPERIAPTLHTIMTADARALDMVDPESVDLVVTSPPYPMIAMWDDVFRTMNGEVGRALDRGDGAAAFTFMHAELARVWRHLLRVVRPGGFLCINVGDAVRTMGGVFRLYSNHGEIERMFLEQGAVILPRIIWRKTTNAPNKFMGSGMLPAGAYVTLEHEYILIFRKAGTRDLSSPPERKRRRHSAVFWEERNAWYSDLWEMAGTRQSLGPDQAARARSAAFPFEIAYRLVAMYSLQGDLVLDPFLGTGTTTLAAAALGRCSRGIDIDPSFTALAQRALPAQGAGLGEVNLERLRRHERFVSDHAAAGKSCAYVNRHYGFPVKTRQETDLLIPVPAAIQEAGQGRYEMTYSIEPAWPDDSTLSPDTNSTSHSG